MPALTLVDRLRELVAVQDANQNKLGLAIVLNRRIDALVKLLTEP